MASIVLAGNTSGSITISSPDVSGSNTLTLPANTGTVITTGSTFGGTGPAFSANANAAQSLTNTTFTKIQIDTELFDTNSNFDPTTNYRFTPTVAGYYQINSGVLVTVGAVGSLVAAIYKNGSLATLGNLATNDGSNAYTGISTLLSLNGSTDYVELYAWHNAGTSKNTIAGSTYTYFQAFLARSA